jgi:putative DNA primase/helicase
MNPDVSLFQQHIDAGFLLVPVAPGTKRPIETDWPSKGRTKATFRPEEFEGKNAAILTGKAAGVICLDIDDLSAFLRFSKDKAIPPLKATREHTTGGGGVHRFYSYPQDVHKYGNRAFKQGGFDIKADGGAVICPGSIHPNGTPYRVSMNAPIIPAPEWLLALCREQPENVPGCPTTNDRPTPDVDVATLPVSERIKAMIRDGLPQGERSEGVGAVLCALLGAGLREADIFAIFASYPIGEKYREKGAARDRWLQDEIARARRHVATSPPPARLESVRTIDAPGTPENHFTAFHSLACLTPSQLQALPLRERQIILDPWILAKSLGMLVGPRGLGKTLFGLAIAHAVSSGAPFAWTAPVPSKVLYVDAEMPVEDAISRLTSLGMVDAERRFLYYSCDYLVGKWPGFRPNLLNEHYRESFKDDVLGLEGIDFVIIDNLSALTPGIDENSKKEWDVIGQWLLSLRFGGVAVLLVHHTGKSGDQRGTSSREDFLDVSLSLKRPPGYVITDGCKFTTTFTKNRISQRDIHKVRDKTFQLVERNGIYCFEWADESVSKKELILKMIDDGASYSDIAAETGVAKSYVAKVAKQAKTGER